jgi:glucose/arabinose dehydrogenase
MTERKPGRDRTDLLSPRNLRHACISVLAAAAMLAGSPPAAAVDPVEAVRVGAFTNPVHVAVAPGYPQYLFVVERPGRIQVLRDENQLAPFLDIRDLVRGLPDAGAGGEEGLLSVAFPPNYRQSRRFYVYFTNANGNIEVNEFRRSTTNPARADRSTRRVVLRIPHPVATNHNGGQMAFGPDGLLYMSTGDGASGRVPKGENARDLNSLLGKVLRIDPFPAPGQPYTIPPDNPYVGREGRDEIFAYGLRNPWRFSFDGSVLTLADVGQATREEVNVLNLEDAAGANFGWPQYEGNVVFDNTRPGADPVTFPIFNYPHNNGRCSIVGGFIVHDATIPSLVNRYIYGDTCSGETWSLIPDIPGQTASDVSRTGIVLPSLASFGVGVNGQIYMAQVGQGGQVWRLEPTPP